MLFFLALQVNPLTEVKANTCCNLNRVVYKLSLENAPKKQKHEPENPPVIPVISILTYYLMKSIIITSYSPNREGAFLQALTRMPV